MKVTRVLSIRSEQYQEFNKAQLFILRLLKLTLPEQYHYELQIEYDCPGKLFTDDNIAFSTNEVFKVVAAHGMNLIIKSVKPTFCKYTKRYFEGIRIQYVCKPESVWTVWIEV